jgi:hypothetical protein
MKTPNVEPYEPDDTQPLPVVTDSDHTRPLPVSSDADTAVVATVGTFASGQAEQGSFHVAADAGLGSFAEGVADERPPETA